MKKIIFLMTFIALNCPIIQAGDPPTGAGSAASGFKPTLKSDDHDQPVFTSPRLPDLPATHPSEITNLPAINSSELTNLPKTYSSGMTNLPATNPSEITNLPAMTNPPAF